MILLESSYKSTSLLIQSDKKVIYSTFCHHESFEDTFRTYGRKNVFPKNVILVNLTIINNVGGDNCHNCRRNMNQTI